MNCCCALRVVHRNAVRREALRAFKFRASIFDGSFFALLGEALVFEHDFFAGVLLHVRLHGRAQHLGLGVRIADTFEVLRVEGDLAVAQVLGEFFISHFKFCVYEVAQLVVQRRTRRNVVWGAEVAVSHLRQSKLVTGQVASCKPFGVGAACVHPLADEAFLGTLAAALRVRFEVTYVAVLLAHLCVRCRNDVGVGVRDTAVRVVVNDLVLELRDAARLLQWAQVSAIKLQATARCALRGGAGGDRTRISCSLLLRHRINLEAVSFEDQLFYSACQACLDSLLGAHAFA